MIETSEDICCRCRKPLPENIQIAILAAKSGNVYHYCSQKCCQADRKQREVLEQVELNTTWPKEI
jgi:hypothetical protein